jgi:hypothetical protein
MGMQACEGFPAQVKGSGASSRGEKGTPAAELKKKGSLF